MKKSLYVTLLATIGLTALAATPSLQRKLPTPPRALTTTERHTSVPQQQQIVANPGNRFLAKSPTITTMSANNAIPSFQLDGSVELRGKVVYANSWTSSDSPKGVYTVPTTAGGNFRLLGTTQGGAYAAYDDGEGHYYDLNESGWGVWMSLVGRVYDTETWSVITPNPTGIKKSAKAIDVDYDPVSGKVYGAFVGESGGTIWGSIDYTSWEMTSISPLQATVSGVACSPQGQYYIYDGNKGILYSIDKENATLTSIGETGLLTQYQSSACFEPKSGKILQVIKSGETTSALYAIDTADASASLVNEFPDGEQILGLYIPRQNAAEGAPSQPSFTVTCPEGNMEALYQLTLPVTTFAGQPLSGELSYTIRVDGADKVNGSGQAGETVTGSVAIEGDAGNHIVTALCANDAGSSPKNIVHIFVGKANPKAVESVTVEYADGKMKFAWTPVKESEGEGYFDASGVTYSIWLGETIIADNISATTYEYELVEPSSYTVYHFSVKARFGDNVSAATEANVIALGAFDLPYSEHFERGVDMTQFTIVNAKEGTQTWALNSSGHITINSDTKDAKDDWFIFPALNMEQGKYYRFTMLAWPNQKQSETFEVKFGAAPSPEAMTGTVLPETDVAGYNVSNKRRVESYFSPDFTGRVFIGLHATTAADAWILLCDEIEISAPLAGILPSEATEMVVTADADFRLKAVVTAKAPVTGMDGEPLTENIQKAVLLRGEDFVGEQLDIEPGGDIRIEDNAVPGNGSFTYSIVCYSHDLPGRPATASQYIGLNVPLPPTGVTITETASPSEVTVSWTAPTEDILGRPLKEENLSYMLFTYNSGRYEYVPQLEQNVNGTSVTLQACNPDTQKFIYYIVDSYNGDIKSQKHSISQLVPVGKSYEAPFRHGFSQADFQKYILGLSSHGEGSWSVYNDAELGIPSQDGDGMIAAMLCQWTDEPAEDIFTGKIHIPSDMKNPVVSLWTFNMTGMKSSEFDYPAEVLNTLAISVICDGDTIELEKKAMKELGSTPGWYKMSAPLGDYRGKTVQVMLTAKSENLAYTFVDNWAVETQFDIDMEMLEITAPSKVKPSEEFPVQVTVRNAGANEAASYTVELYRDGILAATKEMTALPSGKNATAVFSMAMTETEGETATWKATVLIDGDMDADNNTSVEVGTRLQLSNFPVVTDLKGEVAEDGVILSWSEPDMQNAITDPITEDFENATPWTGMVDGWTVVDLDNRPVGGIQGVVLPNGIGGVDEVRAGFFVWDNTSEATFHEGEPNSTWASHSGTRHLSTMFLMDGENCNDDLAISPELYGGAQTVSLYATSYDPTYIDYMSIYYATENTVNPTKFTLLENSGAWVPCGRDETGHSTFYRYEFDLPDGAKRFAIRAGGVSGYVDGFMLMIDDVSFSPANGVSTLELIGYNIYRDGVKINDIVVTETAFIDTDAFEYETPSYIVTAVYNRGESRISNTVTVDLLGVEAAVADDVHTEYYNTMGIKVERKDLKPGIYIRKTGSTAVKVMIR